MRELWLVALTFVAGIFLIVPGCYQRTERPLCADGGLGCRDSRGDGDSDTGSDSDEWCAFAELSATRLNKVDLLFVVDNTGSMAEEQAVLSQQIVLMFEELIHPSSPETTPAIDDLHVGVVSTDMGTHGYPILTCNNPMNGDNGVLYNVGRREGCQPTYSARDCDRFECPWLSHSSELPDDGSDGTPPIWDDFGCIAMLGIGGCGFEQQLESMLVALTAQTEPGRPNEGFLRRDSVLAVIFVTDEDDCSTPNGELFNPAREDFGHLNVRCALNPGELYPIERYAEGLLSLRRGNEDLVMVAGIVGIPIDGSWNPGDSLERLRELEQVNPNNPNELLPSCQTSMGLAFPPVRIVDLVYRFGNNGVLASVCNADWSGVLQAITRMIQRRLSSSCLSRSVASIDISTCRLIETLVDERPCPHPLESSSTRGWHTDRGLDDEGRRRCEILLSDQDGDGCPDGSCDCAPLTNDGCIPGWFYQADSPPCERGRLELTSPDLISDGSEVHLECPSESCG